MAENGLLRLPLELLEMVASHLDDTASISRLCRANRHLYNSLERYLYRYDAVLASGDRCKALLATVAESTLDTDTRVSVARKSLEAGADVNICVDLDITWNLSLRADDGSDQVYESGSILSAAVDRGCLPLVHVLVGFKADINRRTEDYGFAPIAIALLKMWTDVFLFLLGQPAIDLSASEGGHFGLGSVLHIAVAYGRLDFAKTLVPYVNPQVDYGPWNPLLWLAVLRRNSAMVSFLLSCENFDVNALRQMPRYGKISQRENTVFAYTCWHGPLEMVKLLHDNCRIDVDLCGKPEFPPARAVAMRSIEGRGIVDFLIKSSKCKTARDYVFRAACAQGNVELARNVVRLAEDHDKKHANNWIKKAELHNLEDLASSIRDKWRDV